MRPATRSAPTIVIAVLAIVLALVASVPAAAQDEPVATSDPGMTIDPGIPGEPGGGEPGEEPGMPPMDGATPVVPEEGLNDIIEVPWDHITVGPDGRTLTVYFWGGAESCYGLAGVEVDETGAVPVITIQTGTRPGVDVCVALAQLYSTEVILEEPIVSGGVA
jgi:hypothetical protein